MGHVGSLQHEVALFHDHGVFFYEYERVWCIFETRPKYYFNTFPVQRRQAKNRKMVLTCKK